MIFLVTLIFIILILSSTTQFLKLVQLYTLICQLKKLPTANRISYFTCTLFLQQMFLKFNNLAVFQWRGYRRPLGGPLPRPLIPPPLPPRPPNPPRPPLPPLPPGIRINILNFKTFLWIIFTILIYMYSHYSNGRVSDCCLRPTQQFFSYIMVRTS